MAIAEFEHARDALFSGMLAEEEWLTGPGALLSQETLANLERKLKKNLPGNFKKALVAEQTARTEEAVVNTKTTAKATKVADKAEKAALRAEAKAVRKEKAEAKSARKALP